MQQSFRSLAVATSALLVAGMFVGTQPAIAADPVIGGQGGKVDIRAGESAAPKTRPSKISGAPTKSALNPMSGFTRVAQPQVVWTLTYFDGRCGRNDPDYQLMTPEEQAVFDSMNQSGRYTPSWSPANPGAALPAPYTILCQRVPEPAAPLPPPEAIVGVVLVDPAQPADAVLVDQVQVKGGKIRSDFERALLTGAEATFELPENTLDGGEVEQDLSANGWTGYAVGRLQSVSWTFGDGTSASGEEVSHTYQTVGSGTRTVTATTTWVVRGYIRGPITGEVYEFEVTTSPPPATLTMPINQVIAARSENVK